MPHIRLSSEAEVFKVAQSFREVHVFLGYGERAQYADVEEVLTALGTHLKAIQLRCEGSVCWEW